MLNREYLKVKIKDNWKVVVLVKNNNFYYTYYDDAKILRSLFGFIISDNEEVKFKVSNIDKVINKLKNSGLSVMEVDNDNRELINHKVDVNNYDKELKKIYKKIKKEKINKNEI